MQTAPMVDYRPRMSGPRSYGSPRYMSRMYGPGSGYVPRPRLPYGPGAPHTSTSGPVDTSGFFDGKNMRKSVHRRTVDYNTSVVKCLETRLWQRENRDRRGLQPDALYSLDLVPPLSLRDEPMNCVCTKFVRMSTNKFRCPIFCLSWTPEGRRLVTGASSGEFTLWNGMTYNFETILQAHDSAVRSMVWSHNDQWMITADHAGFIKYWQTNMNNVKMYQGHKDPVRGLSFCPTDTKFVSCSDDGTVRVWDFLKCHEEKILRGHGADVKTVDWHPQKSIIASGSKDAQQPIKLWDAKSGISLATIHAHKNTVMTVQWNQNGNWLLTASRDHLCKIFDIRNLKEEMQTFKGHKKEATVASWHPINEGLFASGGSDGALMFWMVGADKEVGAMEQAHDHMVWTMAWHPMGHILATGSNDHSTRFWTRNRPGDSMRDRYNLNLNALTTTDIELEDLDGQGAPSLPGMGLEHGLPEHLTAKDPEPEQSTIPGLDWESDAHLLPTKQDRNYYTKKIPFSRPVPRKFEAIWKENKQPGFMVPEEDIRKQRDLESGTGKGGDEKGDGKGGPVPLMSLQIPDKPAKSSDSATNQKQTAPTVIHTEAGLPGDARGATPNMVMQRNPSNMAPGNIVNQDNLPPRNMGQGNIGPRQMMLPEHMLGNMGPGNQGPMNINPANMGPRNMGPGILGNTGPGNMNQGNMGRGNMNQGNMGPGNMNQGNMGPGNMKQGNMGPGNMNQGNMGPGNLMNQGNMGPGNIGNTGPGNMGPGNMNRDMGPGNMNRDMGPGNMNRDMGPGNMNLDMGPGNMNRDMGPGNMNRDMGPGNMNRDMGPGNMNRDMGPGNMNQDHMGPGNMNRDMGPGNRNRDTGSGNMNRDMGPGNMNQDMGPGNMNRGKMDPVNLMNQGNMGPGNMNQDIGPGNQMQGNLGPGNQGNMGQGNMMNQGNTGIGNINRGNMNRDMDPGNRMQGNMGPGNQGNMGRTMGPANMNQGNMGPGNQGNIGMMGAGSMNRGDNRGNQENMQFGNAGRGNHGNMFQNNDGDMRFSQDNDSRHGPDDSRRRPDQQGGQRNSIAESEDLLNSDREDRFGGDHDNFQGTRGSGGRGGRNDDRQQDRGNFNQDNNDGRRNFQGEFNDRRNDSNQDGTNQNRAGRGARGGRGFNRNKDFDSPPSQRGFANDQGGDGGGRNSSFQDTGQDIDDSDQSGNKRNWDKGPGHDSENKSRGFQTSPRNRGGGFRGNTDRRGGGGGKFGRTDQDGGGENRSPRDTQSGRGGLGLRGRGARGSFRGDRRGGRGRN